MGDGADELYTLKNAFYLGNYQVRSPVRAARRGARGARRPAAEARRNDAPSRACAPAHPPAPAPTRPLQETLAEAGSLTLKTEAQRLERDTYVHRANIGMGQHA